MRSRFTCTDCVTRLYGPKAPEKCIGILMAGTCKECGKMTPAKELHLPDAPLLSERVTSTETPSPRQ